MSSVAIAWVFGRAFGGDVVGVHVLVEIVVLEADPAFALGAVRKRRRALGGRHVGEGRDVVVHGGPPGVPDRLGRGPRGWGRGRSRRCGGRRRRGEGRERG